MTATVSLRGRGLRTQAADGLQMEQWWRLQSRVKHARGLKRHEKEEDLFSDDFNEDFRLPINHRPTENVDLDNVEQASEETELSSSNIGSRLLQKMGWKGKGLGKDEQGVRILGDGITESLTACSRNMSSSKSKKRSCSEVEESVDMDTNISSEHQGNRPIEIEEEEEATQEPSQSKSKCKQVVKNYSQRAECWQYFDEIKENGKRVVGIIEPIKSGIRYPKLGIGKQEDDYFTAEENIQRRKLDIEVEETEEVVRKREVMAEWEQKIQTEVKEIRKVFFCELCNKQYKLAMEFEAHLSSYDHNHRQRFKEMREMHGSNRDDRLKREQQQLEREMAKFAQMADARKQQQLEEREQSGGATASNPAEAETDRRKALKFGFSAKSGTSKTSLGNAAKKPKLPVALVFGNDSDEEQS